MAMTITLVAHIEDARKLLEEAVKEEFEFVMVIGCKGGKISIKHST